MTPTPQSLDRSAPLRALLALFVLIVAALTAAPATAATSPTDPTASGSTVLASTDAAGASAASPPTASAASVAAPETTGAGPAGAAPAGNGASPGPSPILYAAGPAAPPAIAADVRAQPTVIAAGSADSPLGHPTHSQSGGSGSRTIAGQSIISTTHHISPTWKPTVTQLASGGPFVAESGSPSPAPAAPAAPARRHHARPVSGPGPVLPLSMLAPPGVAPAAPSVSVPLVDVYIGGVTSARHPGQKPTPTQAEPIGPAGLPATTLSPFGAAPLRLPGGLTVTYYANAPFSSSTGTGAAPLLELSAMLAAMTLLAGIRGRRRSWDLHVLLGESALLASALDRPG